METSQAAIPESSAGKPAAAHSLASLVQGCKHAWREDDDLYIDGKLVGRFVEGDFVRHAVPGKVPTVLRSIDEDRDAVLIKLIFGSRRLAEAQLRRIGPSSLGCLECKEVSAGPLRHLRTCLAGHVLELLDELREAVAPGVHKLAGEIALVKKNEGAQ